MSASLINYNCFRALKKGGTSAAKITLNNKMGHWPSCFLQKGRKLAVNFQWLFSSSSFQPQASPGQGLRVSMRNQP